MKRIRYAESVKLDGVHEETFVLADTSEQAAFVACLNGPEAHRTKRYRLAHLRERGEVAEQDMPDVRLAAEAYARSHEFQIRNTPDDTPGDHVRLVSKDAIVLYDDKSSLLTVIDRKSGRAINFSESAPDENSARP